MNRLRSRLYRLTHPHSTSIGSQCDKTIVTNASSFILVRVIDSNPTESGTFIIINSHSTTADLLNRLPSNQRRCGSFYLTLHGRPIVISTSKSLADYNMIPSNCVYEIQIEHSLLGGTGAGGASTDESSKNKEESNNIPSSEGMAAYRNCEEYLAQFKRIDADPSNLFFRAMQQILDELRMKSVDAYMDFVKVYEKDLATLGLRFEKLDNLPRLIPVDNTGNSLNFLAPLEYLKPTPFVPNSEIKPNSAPEGISDDKYTAK